MRKCKIAGITIALCLSLCTTAFAVQDPFGIRSVLGRPEIPTDCNISVTAGEVLEFSATDLERRLNLSPGLLGGITITALPLQGILYLDGIEVEQYDFIDRQALENLCFVPYPETVGAVISFLPQCADAVTTNLAIQVLAAPNEAPTIEDMRIETTRNTARRGVFNAEDPEGGSLVLQVVKKPQKGVVTITGLSFEYEPYWNMTGEDSFTVSAIDNAYAFSREAVVTAIIENDESAFYYEDMKSNPSAYAAIKLAQSGVHTGEHTADTYFFHPLRQTTRAEFLVMLLSGAGLTKDVQPSVNTGLPNDSAIPLWLKPYVAAGLSAGILTEGQAFNYNEIPTRAEAVTLTAHAARIFDVKDYELTMSDKAKIPDWALPAYKALAAYKMLDLHYGTANPNGALTNEYSADLVWQLYKHCHR